MSERADFPYAAVPDEDAGKVTPMFDADIEAYCKDMFLKVYKQVPFYKVIPETAILMGDNDTKRSAIAIDTMVARSPAQPMQVVEGITHYVTDFGGVTAIAFFSTVGTLNIHKTEGQERQEAYRRDVAAVEAGELDPNNSEFASPSLMCLLQFRSGKCISYLCPYKSQNGKNTIRDNPNMDEFFSESPAPFRMFKS
jgi:hypothetical protein